MDDISVLDYEYMMHCWKSSDFSNQNLDELDSKWSKPTTFSHNELILILNDQILERLLFIYLRELQRNDTRLAATEYSNSVGAPEWTICFEQINRLDFRTLEFEDARFIALFNLNLIMNNVWLI